MTDITKPLKYTPEQKSVLDRFVSKMPKVEFDPQGKKKIQQLEERITQLESENAMLRDSIGLLKSSQGSSPL